MAYLTAAELTEELRGILHQPDGLTADYWPILITSSLDDAKRTIIRRLVARGYSRAQIEAWDDLKNFHR